MVDAHVPARRRIDELLLRDFDVFRANTPQLLDEVLRLRYLVYCIENAYEDPASFPDDREWDRYDAYSQHAVIVHRPTSRAVGTVRLVVPSARGQTLPIEDLLEDRIPRAPSGRIGEVSRYAISKQFRRRRGEDQYPDVHQSLAHMGTERRVFPQLTLGLMKAVLAFCTDEAIEILCAVMAPALIRLLSGFGLKFEPIGPCLNHHGIRQPCVAYVTDLLRGLQNGQPAFFDIIAHGLDPSQRRVREDRISRATLPHKAVCGCGSRKLR